ncbi:MAG TPA: sensor histidine kinase, partial [Ktedonobacterales bacterium]|nr:sensor histidine kinase [Ktedonobacterales bacterium]
TAVQMCYAVLLWLMVRGVMPNRNMLYLLLFSGLTLISGFLATTGIYWDWLLYLVTVAHYFLMLRLRFALAAAAALYGMIVLNLVFLNHWSLFPGDVSNLLSFISAFAFVGAFSTAMTFFHRQKNRAELLLLQVEQSKHELEEAHTQLQRYATQVEELSMARERTRIAREMHDTLGHYLTILNVQLETISKLQQRDPALAAAEIAEARHVAAQSMQELRNAVTVLRLAGDDIKNLPESLAQLGREFQQGAEGAELTLDLETELPPLSPEIQHALYRAVQEALTNVRKHAHATKVLVRLRYEGEWLEALVLDNGRGVEVSTPGDVTGSADVAPSTPSGGFGLIGLRERVALLGGQMTAGPANPNGFRVTVRLRVSAPQADEVSKAGLAGVHGGEA